MSSSQAFLKIALLVQIFVAFHPLLALGKQFSVTKQTARGRTAGKPIELTRNTDEIVVKVTEQPSTGSFWKCSFDSSIFAIIANQFDATSTSEFPVGGFWNRTLKIVGMKQKNVSVPINCGLARHWEKKADIKDNFKFYVKVSTAHQALRKQSSNPKPSVLNVVEPPVDQHKLRGQQTYPAVYDPRGAPYYPAIRDQEQCGSCWAFATVGQLEVMYALKCNKAVPDLSEQFLVSCNNNGYSCNGGAWSHQYHYTTLAPYETAAGAVPEASFPYTALDSPCDGHPYPHTVKLSSSKVSFAATNESIMANVYQYGAVGTYICMNDPLSYWYPTASDPFFNGVDCTSINHAVVIVGYDSIQKYWIIRNSWGSWWGADGYMYIAWGKANVGYAANYVLFSDCGVPRNVTNTTSPTPSRTASQSRSVSQSRSASQTSSVTATQSRSATLTNQNKSAILTPVTCANFVCPTNYLLKSYPSTITCKSNPCVYTECCNAKATCATFKCPPSTPKLRSDYLTYVCTGTTCATSECCVKK